MAPTTNGNQRKPNHYPYNGRPLQEGEVLAPQFINREYANLIDAKGVRTWYKCGIPFLVMFVPVQADQLLLALKVLNSHVNDYLNEQLGPNRYSRCMVPQPDGNAKACPKEIRGRYNPCSSCPYRGRLPKEDRRPIYLDALEENDYHQIGSTPSAEDCAMTGFMLDDLEELFANNCPCYAEILRLGRQGLEKKDIVRQLPVRKSQGYQLYNDCKKAILDYLKE